MDRATVVSGIFYPKDQDELITQIKGYMSKPDGNVVSALGVILPHAGYLYSGRVAVETLQKVAGAKKIIILGPNHTGSGKPFAVWPNGLWHTPLGDVIVDTELVEKIVSKGELIEPDISAHLKEHSIEVQLPLLQYLYKDFKIAPIACGAQSFDLCLKAGRQIYEALKNEREKVLIVLSTDFTHYEPETSARKKDLELLERIVSLDERGLFDTFVRQNGSMCGIFAAIVFLHALKLLGARKASCVRYMTSGDVSGDFSSVVGYAGVVVH
ncbi:MAG: AmmeMemoRadiSam system protein B [Candidatus Omnitrophica bacterium]|nr:AmmeMemoRadiSam system protein B [Candidatus Omnitrophota bacterium]